MDSTAPRSENATATTTNNDAGPKTQEPTHERQSSQARLNKEFHNYRAECSTPGGLHPALSFGAPQGRDERKERAAERLWESLKKYLSLSTNRSYLLLWKVCLQYGECTPFDIIEVKNLLHFKRETRDKKTYIIGASSEAFSAQLAKLVTHFIWPTSYPGAVVEHIGAAIQYAVILRTNDQRPWDPANGALNPFLEVIRDASIRGDVPMAEVHVEIRRKLADKRFPLPTGSLSSIFLELEKIVETPRQPLSTDEMYFVTTRDLKKLGSILVVRSGDKTSKNIARLKVVWGKKQTAKAAMPSMRIELMIFSFHRKHTSETLYHLANRAVGTSGGAINDYKHVRPAPPAPALLPAPQPQHPPAQPQNVRQHNHSTNSTNSISLLLFRMPS
ncbi:hypothetical protein PWT90_03635 [Aphanocladium album]|nr:hypothetical protein PWT90_03635 [Aphanocladium album]